MAIRFFRGVLAALAAAAWTSADPAAPEEAKGGMVDRKPLRLGMAWEFGQIVKGRERELGVPIRMEAINRLGVALTQEVAVGELFEMRMGVGGLFWNAFPVRAGGAFTMDTRFGPGITQATGVLRLGDPATGRHFLQFGFFPFKYNPDARNLGEYLFRSTPYPGILWSGGVKGWEVVNAAEYRAQGAYFHWESPGGVLTQDATLFMERDYAPMFDLTPSYMAGLHLGDGIFEISAGLSFHHFLPVVPSRLAPTHNNANRYVEFSEFPASAGEYDTVVAEDGRIRIVEKRVDWAGGPRKGMYNEFTGYRDADGLDILEERWYQDALTGQKLNSKQVPDALENLWINMLANIRVGASDVPATNENLWLDTQTDVRMVESAVPNPADPRYRRLGVKQFVETSTKRYARTGEFVYPRQTTYLTIKGTKAMARFAFDPKPLMGSPAWLGKSDLRLYGEAGILGIENQPFYYERRSERIPMMLGFNLPAFGFLDVLAVEAEYFDSPWPNNSELMQREQLPVPAGLGENPARYSPTDADNWKWSVFAKRSFGSVRIFAQAASDHFRTITFDPHPSYEPVVDRLDEWYYMLRLEMGL